MFTTMLCAVLLLIVGSICLTMREFSLGIFNILWATVLFMCCNELGRESCTQTLVLLMLMVVMVNIGFWLGNTNVRFAVSEKTKQSRHQYQFSSRVMVVLLEVLTVVFLYYAVQTIIKFGLNLEVIRGANNSDSNEKVFSSVLDTIVFYGIGMPIIYVGALSCSYNYSQNIQTPHKVYWLLAVNVVLYVIVAGGRTLLLRIAFFFVAAFIWRLKISRRYLVKKLKYLVFCVVALMIIMEILTLARNSNNISFLGQTIVYIRGAVSHMSYQLDQMPADGYYCGYITYGGFVYYPIKLLAAVLGTEWATSNEIMSFLQSYKYLQIGDKTTYFNALIPNAFYYYYDSGYVGVVLFSLFLGFAAARGERAYKSPSFLNFVLWATAVYAIVYSPLGGVLWAFRYPTAVIYCCMLRSILYRRVEDSGTVD